MSREDATVMLAAVPSPPTGLRMPHVAELVFTTGGAVPLVVTVLLALQHLRTGRGPLLAFCLLGGLAASLFEPFVDVMGLVYLTEDGSIGTFTFLGRTMPLFVPVIYPWYIGGFAYLTCRRLAQGVTVRSVFALWGTFVLVNFALEAPGLLTGVYNYYGHQPFNLWGHPLWWGCANAFTALVAGALVYVVRPFLGTGWRLAGVIPLIFVSEGLSNAGTGWPMYVTLGGDMSYPWTYGSALVTVGLIAFLVWVIALIATGARPAAAQTSAGAAVAAPEPECRPVRV
jgi:hypothetical protein